MTVRQHQLEARLSQRDKALEKLRGRKPAERKLSFIFDEDAQRAYDEARTEEYLARESGNEIRIATTRRKVKDAEAALAEESVEFHFRSRGRVAYEEMMIAHPPTEEDNEKERKRTGDPGALATFHEKTFIPAIVSMALVSPELTPEDILELGDTVLSATEYYVLGQTAIDVHTASRVMELGK